MPIFTSSAPGKLILFGDHGVHRKQPNLVTSVDLRTYCQVTPRTDDQFSFRAGSHYEQDTLSGLQALKATVDALREAKALDEIAALASNFFVPSRYVLSNLVARTSGRFGLDIAWRTELPTGSGLGSGAAAFSAMACAAFHAYDYAYTLDDLIFMSWQGDVIAHGGYGSSLDSTAIAMGSMIWYSLEDKPKPFPFKVSLPLIIGDTLVQHSTAAINTHIRLWLQERPSRIHVFRDMHCLEAHFVDALRQGDLESLGHLMNLHQLIQEKLGSSCPEIEKLIDAAIDAGAFGAKISGSGGGGIIIAVAPSERVSAVAEAINSAGGRSYIVQTDVPGVRLEPDSVWDSLATV